MKIAHAKTINQAIDNLHTFFLVDLYSKFRPEMKIKGEKWCRTDYFKKEIEFQDYLEDHFKVLKKEIRRLR